MGGNPPPRIAVLTVSDGASAGRRGDVSGALLGEWISKQGWELAGRATVPDETHRIVPQLLEWCDSGHDDKRESVGDTGATGAGSVDMVVTTGGTGFGPRDVTPEATRAVTDREAPGLAEAIRAAGAAKTRFACLSRGLVGIRGNTAIVNLPGSPGGVKDAMAVLEPLVPHLTGLLRGDTEHGRDFHPARPDAGGQS